MKYRFAIRPQIAIISYVPFQGDARMSAVLESIKSQIRSLESQEKAEIASFAISSLDDDLESDDAELVRAEWKEELDRRYEEFESGIEPGIPFEEAMTFLRKKHQK